MDKKNILQKNSRIILLFKTKGNRREKNIILLNDDGIDDIARSIDGKIYIISRCSICKKYACLTLVATLVAEIYGIFTRQKSIQ